MNKQHEPYIIIVLIVPEQRKMVMRCRWKWCCYNCTLDYDDDEPTYRLSDRIEVTVADKDKLTIHGMYNVHLLHITAQQNVLRWLTDMCTETAISWKGNMPWALIFCTIVKFERVKIYFTKNSFFLLFMMLPAWKRKYVCRCKQTNSAEILHSFTEKNKN